MSGSAEPGSLQRAHALSAQASQLLHNPTPSIATLTSALDAYRQAADLFAQAAAGSSADSGTLKTLQLLTAQHRKLVRDLERRIGQATAPPLATQHPNLRRAATVPAPSPGVSSGIPTVPQGRVSSDRRPTSPIKRPNEPAGLAAIGVSPSPFFASSTAAPRPLAAQGSISRPLPPFAQRPPPSSAITGPSSSGSTPQPPPTLSPLYSSASSSDPDPAESYITFGLGLSGDPSRHGGREVDPFSRFWGMLEECLDEVSRPVAFASAPLGNGAAEGGGQEEEKVAKGGKIRKGKERKVAADTRDGGTPSPSDSFYMIPAEGTAATSQKKPRGSPSVKTPEELALENESLRASLDALAVHTQQVEKENQELKKRSQEREAVLRTVAEGVRKEAEKARLDTSVLLRSQIIGVDAASPRQAGPGVADPARSSRSLSGDAGLVRKLQRRVGELEDEVKVLKGENEKQKGSIQKYKDRFDKIKTSARAKREARGGSFDTAGKDTG